ncbi:Ig-like V-type domain-containing protein FAM187A [Clupea harengus]|uniref:Ig-like V-type domain-containing protein FAM187A n=1 Tax=Clupea harengus TaxID=7950 RepID=A0A6P3W7J5_CLUHA|nr:Ig-like V-type domain-containing protein FAM187A [Clupea harengus]
MTFFLLIFCVSLSTLVAYEAPEDKEDVFASRVCPAFLVFDNAAYLSDMTIELPCHCKPEEAHSVVWYYQKQLGSTDIRALTDFQGTSVVDSSHVGRGSELRSRFSIRLFSLLIFRAQESDSGHYLCGTVSGEFFYGYDVDVQKAKKVSFLWSKTQRVAAVKSGDNLLFQVFTSFWSWSVCDRCDVPGEQTRVGLCYVKSDYLEVRYRRETHKVTSCGSSAVPKGLGLEKDKYGAELGVKNCNVPCPPKTELSSPEHQALLEFLGYSEQKPSVTVPVYYHNHQADTLLILSCPGARPEHAVAWDRGSMPLYRSQYMEGLNQSARIFIDTGHHLHFQPVQLEDKGSYFCWLQGKYAAEIRLGVYLRLGQRRLLSDPESMYALKVILICYMVLTAVFLLIVFGQCFWRTLKAKRLTLV